MFDRLNLSIAANATLVSVTVQNSMHTYSAAGNYTVNLTATNANGINSKTSEITVLEKTVSVTNWEFSPQKPVSGDTLNIKGNASSGEKIDVFVNFNKTVPVLFSYTHLRAHET